MKNRDKFSVGDFVLSTTELTRNKGMIKRSVIGIVTHIPGDSSIYEVVFQGCPESHMVWDFQLERFNLEG